MDSLVGRMFPKKGTVYIFFTRVFSMWFRVTR